MCILIPTLNSNGKLLFQLYLIQEVTLLCLVSSNKNMRLSLSMFTLLTRKKTMPNKISQFPNVVNLGYFRKVYSCHVVIDFTSDFRFNVNYLFSLTGSVGSFILKLNFSRACYLSNGVLNCVCE